MVKIIGIGKLMFCFQFQFGVINLPLFSPAKIYAPTKTSICGKTEIKWIHYQVPSLTVSISETWPWLCRTHVHSQLSTFLWLQAPLSVTHSQAHLCPTWWTWQEQCPRHRLEISSWWLTVSAHSQLCECSRCSRWQSKGEGKSTVI